MQASEALVAAFERGNFADTRARASAILSDASASDEERKLAEDYRARTQPPSAARFALWVTLALVTVLSVYFALLNKRG